MITKAHNFNIQEGKLTIHFFLAREPNVIMVSINFREEWLSQVKFEEAASHER